MPSFMQAIKGYQANKETKVNPPEAAKVLEEKSAPEVENETPPAEPAAAPEASSSNSESPAAPTTSTDAGAASSDAPKARGRGRPAGSKNAPKPPAAAAASEATRPIVLSGAVDPNSDIDDLCAALTARGFEVTLRFIGRPALES